MAARAIWKGWLEIGELTCPVALHAAASTADRVAFHILNRNTGNRVSRVYVDADTGKPVEREDQAKGYETERGKTVLLDDEEIAAAVPENDKTLEVQAFVPCEQVDTLFLDRPYYLTPTGEGEEAFAVIRDGIAKAKVAALAHAVLFRRMRAVLIRANGDGLLAHTLEYEHEVKDAARAFKGVPSPKVDAEMLELAEHIIKAKRGKFQPEKFVDRYDDALAELVKAKAAGKPLPKPKEPEETKVVDLMQTLRDSLKPARKSAAPKRKAG